MYIQYERGTCAECLTTDVLIVHKRRNCCGMCVGKNKKKTVIRAASKKGKEINLRVKKTYKKLDDTRDKICTGCESRDVPLSRSHLVPRSANKELAYNLDNITYHCLDRYDLASKKLIEGCHAKWESHNPEKMRQLKDFKVNMEKISKLDERYYMRLCSKIISK